MSRGEEQKPISKEYINNYDRIFGKKKGKPEEEMAGESSVNSKK